MKSYHENGLKFQKGELRSNSLTIEEQADLIRELETVEDEALFKLELSSGIRREDIVSIEWENIDYEKKELKFWERKKHRYHTVPLKDEVITALRKLQDVSRYMKPTPKQNKHPRKYVFTFTGKTAYNRLQYYLKKAGIQKENISFHDLRRSFTKTAKRKGLSLKAVAQILGDLESTVERYYSNLDMSELKEELNKL